MGSFASFVVSVVKALEESGVEYVIVGGVAAIHYGRVRLTQDVDVIVLIERDDEKSVKSLVTTLRKHGFQIGEEALRTALREKSHLTIFHKAHPVLHLDLKGVYSDLDRLILDGKVRAHLYCCTAWVEAPEDLIVAKLVYGSAQDIEDAAVVLLTMRDTIDMARLREKARRFGVENLLDALCSKVSA